MGSRAGSEVQQAWQLQAQHDQAGCRAEVHARGGVAVLALALALGLLAEDPLEARHAEAALVVVAGAPILAQQELVITDVGCRERERARRGEGAVGTAWAPSPPTHTHPPFVQLGKTRQRLLPRQPSRTLGNGQPGLSPHLLEN